ncbi:MAG TPA: citramalate synthase, partial [Methylomirabilota bacterium]|nr:citramalate synthase [Methylomirabilota bacterium]
MARLVKIYDTTLRDGTQGEGVAFSMEDKVRLAQRLDALGVHYIEGGWPGSNPKDMRFFRRIQDVPLKHARVAAFGATRRAGIKAEDDPSLQALVEARTPVATIFGKSWPFHVTHALQTTLPENLAMIADSVAFLARHFEEAIYDAEHFFDGMKRDREYALQTLKAAEAAGARCLVLCDTNGGALPHEVAEIVREVRRHVSTPLGIHAHNDGECAVANSLAAVLEGAAHVQGTLNGYGERCGNANLVSIIPNLMLKLGAQAIPELNLRELRDVARFASELANRTPWQHQPFVGDSAFAHKAGMHVSAVLKHPETYEHVNPEVIGNRRRVLVSELAGKSNILWKAQEYGIDLGKDTPETRRILETLKTLEDEGYLFEGAEASFELLMERALGHHRAYFELDGYRVTVEARQGDREPLAEATVRV